jgi:hypothetical protein
VGRRAEGNDGVVWEAALKTRTFQPLRLLQASKIGEYWVGSTRCCEDPNSNVRCRNSRAARGSTRSHEDPSPNVLR